MADTKEKIYRIKFEGMDQQLSNLVAIKKSIEDLNKAKKDLDTTTDEGRKKQEEYILQIKNLNKQYQDQQKEIDKTDKIQKTSADTLEKMRAKLSLMRAELEKIPIGTKNFENQTKSIKDLQDKLNGADEASGRFFANVGNYKDGIISAFKEMGINVDAITSAINGAKTAQLGLTAATTGTSGAMKVLKIALASTGIGLIVIALGSLVAYLTSTQEGIDKVNKVLEPLKTIFQRIVGIVQEFGKGLAMLFSGDFKGGMEQLGATISNVGTNLKDAANDGKRLAQITIEIEQARIKLAENEARIRREIAEQRTILSDISLSDTKRVEAGEKYKTLRNELLELDKVIAKLEYEQALIKSEQNDGDREAQEELARKKEAINALEATALMEQKEAQTQIQRLLKASSDARLKAYDDELKKIAEFEKERLKIIDDANRQAAENKKAIEAENPEDYQFTKEVDPLMDKIVTDTIAQQTAIREQEQLTADLEYELKNQKIQGLQDASNALIQFVGRTSTVGKALYLFNKAAAITEIIQSLNKEKAGYWANPTWSLLPDGGAAIKAAFSAMANVRAGISIASIAAQSFQAMKFAKGGIVGGNTHENGGTVYRGSDGQVFEAERGELITVVNRHDTERLRMLSAANAVHGRAFFASGGVMTPNSDFSDRKMRAIIQETVNSISSIPVVVSERDISKSQRRVSVIENAGNL